MRGTIGNEKNHLATSDFSLGEMVRTELLEWDIVGYCGRWQVPDGSVVDEANKPRELDVP